MIFNTFDSDIKDATSALDIFKKKFGLFGKSLSQWGELRSEWNKEIDKITVNSGANTKDKKAKRKAQKEAKNQVGSLYSYARKQRTENEVTSKFFVTKKSIQPFMQSGWFENFDDKKAQDILDKLKAQQDAIDKMGISTDSAKLKWEEYFETADESEKWQKTFVKDGKLVATNLDDITIGQKNAAKAAKQHDANLGKMTIGAELGKIALDALKTALSTLITWGVMELIQLAIKGLDQIINAATYASEAANEAFSESSEKVKEYEEESKSLDELISKYKELKESGTLDTDSRKEIKNIQKDIADLVGVQASNLDLVNGKLDEEIAKLNKISKDEAKRTYETATANYNNAKKASDKAIGSSKYGFGKYAYVGKREKGAEKILKDAGFIGISSGGIFGNKLFVMDDLYKGAEDKANFLQSMIDVLEQNGQSATDLYAGLISQRDKYLKYIDDQQNAANSLVNSWISYSQFSNEELTKINVDSLDSFEEYHQKMIEEAKHNESIGEALADGTLSEDDLEAAINTFMSTSNDFSKWYDEWINGFSDDSSSTQTGLGKLKQQREDLGKQISELNKKKQDLGKQSKLYTGLVEQGIGFIDPFGSSSQSPKIKNAFIKSLDDYSNALDDEISKIESNKTELDNQIASLESDLNFGKIWDSLDDTSDEDLKNFKSEILQLADAGQLTFYTFNQTTGSDAFLKKIGIDAEAAIEKIERLSKLSTQLSSGNAQFSKMSDLLKESNENGYVSADSLTGFDDAVKNMPVWEEYERIMMDAASTAEQRQKITNALATEYFNTTDYFAKLTEENKGAYITQLKGWGVQNADEIVNNQLYKVAKDRKDALAASDEFLAEKSKEVGEATANEIHQLLHLVTEY